MQVSKSRGRRALSSYRLLLLGLSFIVACSIFFFGLSSDLYPSLTYGYQSHVSIKPKDGIRFVFAFGIEGTGHHFLTSLGSESAGRVLMKKWDLFPHQMEISKMIKRFYLIEGCNEEKEKDLGVLYNEIVEKLQLLHNGVKEKLAEKPDGHYPSTVKTIHLNLLPGQMASFPMWAPCRNHQYFSLNLLYKACSEAGVTCQHVMMFRDAHEVVRSTVQKRKFETNGRKQVIILTHGIGNMINEMLQFPDRLLACFNYNNPTEGIQDWGQDMFGRTIPDGELARTINEMYQSSNSKVNYTEITPPGFDLYMDELVRLTDYAKNMCDEQLQQIRAI